MTIYSWFYLLKRWFSLIFHSYVSLPEGTSSLIYRSWAAYCCDTRGCRCSWAVWTRALPRPETTTKNAVAPWRMGCGVLLANIKNTQDFCGISGLPLKYIEMGIETTIMEISRGFIRILIETLSWSWLCFRHTLGQLRENHHFSQ